jgi:hypothetical protein
MSKEKTVINYKSNYETARIISMFISAIGWLMVAGGILILFGVGGYDKGVGLGIGLGVAFLGLPLILSGQITRAVVDNADANKKVLEILKHKENVEFSEDENEKAYKELQELREIEIIDNEPTIENAKKKAKDSDYRVGKVFLENIYFVDDKYTKNSLYQTTDLIDLHNWLDVNLTKQ